MKQLLLSMSFSRVDCYRMMAYLPYRVISVYTPLTVEQASKRLSRVIIPKRFHWGYAENVGRYEGYVSPDGFTINRIIGYQNGFRPILQGHFYEINGKTQVVVKIKLPPLTLFIMSIYLGLSGLSFLAALVSSIVFGSLISGIICPGAMFLVGCMLMVDGFSREATQATAFIDEIFTGKLAPE